MQIKNHSEKSQFTDLKLQRQTIQMDLTYIAVK